MEGLERLMRAYGDHVRVLEHERREVACYVERHPLLRANRIQITCHVNRRQRVPRNGVRLLEGRMPQSLCELLELRIACHVVEVVDCRRAEPYRGRVGEAEED